MKEKVKPDSARKIPKRVQGTVLFTVVCVMMVLIVFLMGTLALAATANNRAYSNYQKAQIEATARAVLDAATEAVLDDTAATGIRADIVSGGSFLVQLGSAGETYTVDARNTGEQKSYYDTAENLWKQEDIYELSVTIDKTQANTTYNAYVTARAVTTTTPGGGGGGGAFVSMGGASTIGTGGYITGGTYVGIDSTLPGPAVGYYTIADNDVLVDSPYYINGSAVTGGGASAAIHFTAPGDYFAVIGDFTENQANQFKTEYAGFNWGTYTTTGMDYNKTPYIYVDGVLKLNGNSNSKIGDTIAPTNVYCGTLDAKGKLEVRGDIYTFDSGADNQIGQSGYVPALYKWASATLTINNAPKATNIYGNWFSKGNIKIYCDGNKIEGDLRSEGDITLEGNNSFTVDGDIICGGTLTINNVNVTAKNVYAANIVTNRDINCVASYSYELTGNTPANYTQFTGGGIPIGTQTITTTVTMNNDTASGWNNGLKVEYGFDGDPMHIRVSLSYFETTEVEFNGVITTIGPEEKTSEECIWGIPWDWVGSMQDYVESGAVAKYNEAIALQATAGTPVVTSETVYQYDVESELPTMKKPIYPADYDRTNVRTTISLGTPAPTDYDGYKKDSSTFISKGQEITALSDFENVAVGGTPTSAFYHDPAGYYVIKGACHIKNVTFNQNVYIDPNSDIRVILENCTFGSSAYASLISNDTHEVTLHIIGEVKFNMGSIFTKYYWDTLTGKQLNESMAMNGTSVSVQQEHTSAADPDYPNLIINSDPGATLNMAGSSNNMMTAMVRAPQMSFKQGLGLQTVGITYTNKNGAVIQYGSGAGSNSLTSSFATSKIERVSMIGQLIAGDIELPNNAEWGMIFVEIPSGGLPPTTPPTTTTTPFSGDSSVLYYNYY